MFPEEPLFSIGKLYMTPGGLEALEDAKADIQRLLMRHVSGDWSEMVEEDQRANHEAVLEGGRVFSSFRLANGVKVWIITEADRSYTTILLPEEY